jgi:uncharacterized protein (DUF1778 family)
MANVSTKRHKQKSGRVSTRPLTVSSKDANLLVRFDRGAKSLVQQAASLRGLTVSDYVRSRIVPMAKQEVDEASTGVLRLPKEAQIAFWQALQRPPASTKAQRALGKLVRSVM